MSERTQAKLVGAIGIAVIALLFVIDPRRHGALFGLAWAVSWTLAPALRNGLGRPARWAFLALVLLLAGGLLGPSDRSFHGVRLSLAGVFAAGTMLARAHGLVALSTGAMVLVPPARAIARLRGTRWSRIGEVILVALDLGPSLATALVEARAAQRERFPGLTRAPRRWFELAVFAVGHASNLAEQVAGDLGRAKEESP